MPSRQQSPQVASQQASGRVRKAIDSLVSDVPLSGDELSALTESERAEVAALTRTAHLTRLVLNGDAPAPDQNTEAAALHRAQAALRTKGPVSSVSHDYSRRTTSWLGKLMDRMRDVEGDRS